MSDAGPAGAELGGIVEHSTGIDWVRTIIEDTAEARELADWADEQHRADEQQGSAARPYFFQGYKGWRTASVSHGWYQGALILESSSGAAGPTAIRLRRSTGRTTRLDAQVTVRLSAPRSDCAELSTLRSTERTEYRRSSQALTGLSSQSDGLCIGTVGRRTAPRYLRCYDKGVQSKAAPPGLVWRWELEAKYSLAGVLWQDFQRAQDVPSWCYRSVESQWKASGCSWPLPNSERLSSPLRPPKRPPAPAATLAAWLRATVAPTLPRVLRAYSTAELLELLGISHLAQPIPGRGDGPD